MATGDLRPKLGRHAAVWGGFNKINKLTRRAAPASEAWGGANLTKDPFVIASPLTCHSQRPRTATSDEGLSRRLARSRAAEIN